MHYHVWQPISEPLMQRFKLHYADLPGHGGCNYEGELKTLDSWTHHLLKRTPDQAIWMAWSLAGLAAIHVAVHHPERIKRLILVASTPCFAQKEDWPYGLSQQALADFSANLDKPSEKVIRRFIAIQALASKDAQRYRQQLHALLAGAPLADKQALRDGMALLTDTDIRNKLSKINCPCDFILGEHDTLAPQGIEREIGSLNPNINLRIIPGAGHAPFLSHRDEFTRLVDQIL